MVNIEQVFKEVDNLEKEHVMEIMRALVGVNTSNPPGNAYREFVDVISPYY